MDLMLSNGTCYFNLPTFEVASVFKWGEFDKAKKDLDGLLESLRGRLKKDGIAYNITERLFSRIKTGIEKLSSLENVGDWDYGVAIYKENKFVGLPISAKRILGFLGEKITKNFPAMENLTENYLLMGVMTGAGLLPDVLIDIELNYKGRMDSKIFLAYYLMETLMKRVVNDRVPFLIFNSLIMPNMYSLNFYLKEIPFIGVITKGQSGDEIHLQYANLMSWLEKKEINSIKLSPNRFYLLRPTKDGIIELVNEPVLKLEGRDLIINEFNSMPISDELRTKIIHLFDQLNIINFAYLFLKRVENLDLGNKSNNGLSRKRRFRYN